jgi:tetratricopeptide (TPR) repeat protein
MDSNAPITEDIASRQTETALTRISLAVSTLTSVTTLLVSVASDAATMPWLLGGASIITITCLGFLFVALKPLHDERKRRFFGVAAAASVMALAIAWAVVYRDDFRYSAIAKRFSNAPPVLVDEGIARVLVSSKVGETKRTGRLVSVMDSLVEEPHHTSVSVGPTPDTAGAFLRLSGAAAESRFSLTLAAPSAQALPRLAIGHLQAAQSASELLALVANDDYFFSSSLASGPLAVTIAGAPSTLQELLVLSYRAVGGVAAARRSNPTLADAHFAQFRQVSEVLSDDTVRSVSWLPDAFLFAAHRLLAAGKAADASAFLDRGLVLRPENTRLRVAAEYLKLRRGDTPTFAGSGDGPDQGPSDAALGAMLRALWELKSGSAYEAIRHFELAADGSRSLPTAHQFGLHTAIALLLSEVKADPRDRATRILKQTAAAEGLSPGMPLTTLLTGVGYALDGNSRKSQEAFDQVRQNTKSEELRRACDYWQALALSALNEQQRALELLRELERLDPTHARVLGLLAELSARHHLDDIDASEPDLDAVQRGLQLANRALKQNPEEARSRRLLGAYKAAEAARNRGQLRSSLLQEALGHLHVARRKGQDDSRLYEQISWIQRELAQAADAKLAARTADEVACHRERRMESCSVLAVRALLEKNDVDGAIARTNDLIRTLNRTASSSERANSLLISMAIAWYEANHLDQAQGLYHIVRKNVGSGARGSSTSLRSALDCNEGFILVDSGESHRAQALFRRGLDAQRSADCEAGLAIALFDGGQREEARARYRSARQQDDNYGNVDVLRRNYFWSPRACSLAGELRQLN